MDKKKFEKLMPNKQLMFLENVYILENCEDFYNSVLECTKHANKIYFACLALGFDRKTSALSDALEEKVQKNHDVLVLSDKTRNMTDKKIVKMIKTHKLYQNVQYVSVEMCRFFPSKINEALGVFHSKIYVMDDFVIVTGANLYKEYYENRVDRWYLIKDEQFAKTMVKEMFGLDVAIENRNSMDILKNISYEHVNNVKIDVKTFNNLEEKRLLLQLFETSYEELHISTAYPNFSTEYCNALRNKKLSIYSPAPENNTFFVFGIINNIITKVYAYSNYYIASRLNQCDLYEFVKPNHSFHKKGMWIFYKSCAISIVGSSNFNVRSNVLDIEQNWIMYSEDKKMIDLWKNEIESLRNDCKLRTASELEHRRIWYIILLFFVVNFLFYFFAKVFDPMEKEEFEGLREKIEKYTPMLPDSVIDYFMEKNGVQSDNEEVKKMISLLSHKFLTDVAINAFQFHKIHVKARSKDKRFGKEKKPTLQVVDLEKALEEMGIDISRPYFYK